MAMILVHGASHGAWAWHKVTPLLRASGIDVIALDLPGHGRDGTRWDDVTFTDLVAAVCAELDAQDEPSVLVAHSLAGAVASRAAELRPDAIRRLVYVAAVVPADGECAIEASADPADAPAIMAARRETPSSRFDELPFEALQGYLYNQCSVADVELARMMLVPLASRIILEPVRLSPEAFGRVPKAYVACTADHVIPHPRQAVLATRAGCEPVVTMGSDHSPFFSHPAELADVLVDLAR